MKRKILIVCSSGLGTSLMIRLQLQNLLKELGVEAEIEHTDLSSIHLEVAELIIGAKQIVESIRGLPHTEIIPLDDLVNREHLKDKLLLSKTYQNWSSS